MKRIVFILVLSLPGLACGASFLEQIQKIEPSMDPSYAYTAENPVRIGYDGPGGSIRATYYFLSCLRSLKGDTLELLGRVSLADPNYRPSFFSSLPKRFGSGTDPDGILDCYTLRVKGTTDTLRLFFDIYNKGPIMIPRGLAFDKSER